MIIPRKDYFEMSREWFVDRHQETHRQMQRWAWAFFSMTLFSGLLIVALMVLLPLKTLVPLVIHENIETGEIWVDPPKARYIPPNDAEVQSDLVRYIIARESYSAVDINQRFHSVILLSASDVAKEYEKDQANNNPKAPINIFGKYDVQKVRIEDIVFIDRSGLQEIRHFQKPSQNLAKIDFTTTTRNESGQETTRTWVATISWMYQGLPHDQQEAWENWNGFTVTSYRVDLRQVER